MSFHYIQLTLGDKIYTDKVSAQGCEDFADFRVASKNKFSPVLDTYGSCQLTLLQPDGSTQIDLQTPLAYLKEMHLKTIVVIVQELPIHATRPKKQLIHKRLAESSVQNYYDTIARKLALYYRFKWGSDDNNMSPTIADVLHAKQKNDWDFRYRQKSYSEKIDECEITRPILPIRLPDLFDEDEWVKLKEWNDRVKCGFHDTELRKIRIGNNFVAIPRADYNEETVSFFQTIGGKDNCMMMKPDDFSKS